MINVVDMRDHFFRYPYEMMKYSDAFWKKLTTQKGGSGFQNRWRLGRWCKTLEDCGFESRVLPILEEKRHLQKVKPFFDEQFRNLPDSELSVLCATIISHKPAA